MKLQLQRALDFVLMVCTFQWAERKKQTAERSLYEIKLPVLCCFEAVHAAFGSGDSDYYRLSLFHWFLPSASPAQPQVRICH